MERTAHDVRLYELGKGILKIDRFDEDGLPTGLRDVGNAINFNLTINITKKDHYSERERVRTLDLQVIDLRTFTGDFELDEMDRKNLQLWLMANPKRYGIAPMTAGELEVALDFVATNDVGPKYHYQGWKVKLFPKGNLGLISDDWAKLGFEWMAENDATGHPTCPYGDLTLLGES